MLIVLIAAGLAANQATSKLVDCGSDATEFMRAYASDLSRGDRGAVAARYSALGAYSLGFTPKSRDSFDAIGKRYASPEWQKPDKFAWQDLSYEQISPDTCLVVGGFSWTAGSRTAQMAYTAVLRVENNNLRIILEHENMLAGSPAQK
ncbi:hypothetical protein OMW55_11690 [Sphingomonas sp. BN140010]|uniref:SnoaL-like domain-containing protein n=1 Tax=Sphingomonas arvum TaxID=2992113 RepID=A0ABT3JHB1_9SPHN|nr:hypothetical protein [Sphingomonas sp. BN140010]MCW3798467.1 hypothetical protein [Sphingomonas sp. BN140010]